MTENIPVELIVIIGFLIGGIIGWIDAELMYRKIFEKYPYNKQIKKTKHEF